MALAERIRRASLLTLHLAIDRVQTVAGALAMRRAEQEGLARPSVLRAADKRVAELRGEDAADPTRLVVAAEAVETDRIVWEQARAAGTAPPRIVAGVGRGRWARRL